MSKRSKLLLFITVLVLVLAGITFVVLYKPDYKVKSGEIRSHQIKGGTKEITLTPTQKYINYVSPEIEAEFEFNALAPYWTEKIPEGSERKFYVRVLHEGTWSEWIEQKGEGAVRDDEPHPERTYAESPLFIIGKKFQYKIELNRADSNAPTPEVRDVNLSYIDSREPAYVSVIHRIQNFGRVLADDQGPHIVSRAEWGSPDPYGELFKNNPSLNWKPTYAPVTQFFVHHTVNSNYNPNPSEIVRGIWQFHTYTRGWGDIGYNYLIDQNGTIYEGRHGGDNVVGGHTKDYNTGSMAVALIGCHDTSDPTCRQLNGGRVAHPTAATYSSLTTLLSWKSKNYELDPLGRHVFCQWNGGGCLDLPVIAGHRDANSTSCPGDLVYGNLDNVRSETSYKNATYNWGYSAKQLSYNTTNNSGGSDDFTVTLQYKNTGSISWSNTANRVLLKTAVPPDRVSTFQGSGWLDASTPAVLNESVVNPGQVGTFTLHLRRPLNSQGVYQEFFRLQAEGIGDLKSYYMSAINIFCNIGSAANPRPNGVLVNDVITGKVYMLENGKKRWLKSAAAVYSNGYNFDRLTNISGAEAGLYPTGKDMYIREGTLISSPNAGKVYMIEETPDGYARHWVHFDAFQKFSLQWKVVQVSDAELAMYFEGDPLTAASDVPDGLLVNDSATGKVYLIQEGKKRWVLGHYPLFSNGFIYEDITNIDSSLLSAVPNGDPLKIREGTLMTSAGSQKLFVIDRLNGVYSRRWIRNSPAVTSAGFSWNAVNMLPDAEVDSYGDTASLSCHQ